MVLKTPSQIESKFINTSMGKRLQAVDTTSLSPCTTDLAHTVCTFEDSHRVVLVDTPAFPDHDGDASVSPEKKHRGVSDITPTTCPTVASANISK